MKVTTLKELFGHEPCRVLLSKIINSIYSYRVRLSDTPEVQFNMLTDEEKNSPVSIHHILKTIGLIDTIWVLQIFAETPDWYRFKADIAETVLHMFEVVYPDDLRPRLAITAARDYADGKITKEALHAAYNSACDAYVYTNNIARELYDDMDPDADAYVFATNAAYVTTDIQVYVPDHAKQEAEEILLKYIS